MIAKQSFLSSSSLNEYCASTIKAIIWIHVMLKVKILVNCVEVEIQWNSCELCRKLKFNEILANCVESWNSMKFLWIVYCLLWVDRIVRDRWKGRLVHLVSLDAMHHPLQPTPFIWEIAPSLELTFIIRHLVWLNLSTKLLRFLWVWLHWTRLIY